MSSHHDEAALSRYVRSAIMVFVLLWVLTAVTVALYYVHASKPVAITLALSVATIKGSLVASYFMHLIDERKLIYFVLVMTFFFFVGLLLLPLLGLADQVMK